MLVGPRAPGGFSVAINQVWDGAYYDKDRLRPPTTGRSEVPMLVAPNRSSNIWIGYDDTGSFSRRALRVGLHPLINAYYRCSLVAG